MTTGEAAEILGVSRSTASRYFDKRRLVGSTNPITGDRDISQASVLKLIKDFEQRGKDMSDHLKRLAKFRISQKEKEDEKSIFNQKL